MTKKIVQILAIFSWLSIIILSGCSKAPITSIDSFDGVKISFDNQGKGSPAIIFIHGWTNNRTIWEVQTEHFSEKYQVIAVDLPGCGKSGNNRNDWTMRNFGKDISKLIEKLELKRVILVGFSMGAPVALEAATLLPDNIIGVVLVDNLQQIEMQIPPEMEHMMDSIMMDLVNNVTKEKLVAGGFFKHNIDESYNKVVAMLDKNEKIGWQESLAGIIKWTNENCINTVKQVKAPIIAINSDMQPTNVEAFRKYSPTYKAKIVNDVGHVIMWDKPNEFNQLLEESIQEFTKR